MLIRLGYDIQFETVGEVPIVTLLNVHPSRTAFLRAVSYTHLDVYKRQIEGSAERDSKVLKVSADPDPLGINTQRAANWAGKLVSESDLAVHPTAYGLNALPPFWCVPK